MTQDANNGRPRPRSFWSVRAIRAGAHGLSHLLTMCHHGYDEFRQWSIDHWKETLPLGIALIGITATVHSTAFARLEGTHALSMLLFGPSPSDRTLELAKVFAQSEVIPPSGPPLAFVFAIDTSDSMGPDFVLDSVLQERYAESSVEACRLDGLGPVTLRQVAAAEACSQVNLLAQYNLRARAGLIFFDGVATDALATSSDVTPVFADLASGSSEDNQRPGARKFTESMRPLLRPAGKSFRTTSQKTDFSALGRQLKLYIQNIHSVPDFKDARIVVVILSDFRSDTEELREAMDRGFGVDYRQTIQRIANEFDELGSRQDVDFRLVNFDQSNPSNGSIPSMLESGSIAFRQGFIHQVHRAQDDDTASVVDEWTQVRLTRIADLALDNDPTFFGSEPRLSQKVRFYYEIGSSRPKPFVLTCSDDAGGCSVEGKVLNIALRSSPAFPSMVPLPLEVLPLDRDGGATDSMPCDAKATTANRGAYYLASSGAFMGAPVYADDVRVALDNQPKSICLEPTSIVPESLGAYQLVLSRTGRKGQDASRHVADIEFYPVLPWFSRPFFWVGLVALAVGLWGLCVCLWRKVPHLHAKARTPMAHPSDAGKLATDMERK